MAETVVPQNLLLVETAMLSCPPLLHRYCTIIQHLVSLHHRSYLGVPAVVQHLHSSAFPIIKMQVILASLTFVCIWVLVGKQKIAFSVAQGLKCHTSVVSVPRQVMYNWQGLTKADILLKQDTQKNTSGCADQPISILSLDQVEPQKVIRFRGAVGTGHGVAHNIAYSQNENKILMGKKVEPRATVPIGLQKDCCSKDLNAWVCTFILGTGSVLSQA